MCCVFQVSPTVVSPLNIYPHCQCWSVEFITIYQSTCERCWSATSFLWGQIAAEGPIYLSLSALSSWDTKQIISPDRRVMGVPFASAPIKQFISILYSAGGMSSKILQSAVGYGCVNLKLALGFLEIHTSVQGLKNGHHLWTATSDSGRLDWSSSNILTARNTHFNQLSDTFPSEESVEKIMWLVIAVASTCITNDNMTQVHLWHYCLFRDMWKFSSKLVRIVTQK